MSDTAKNCGCNGNGRTLSGKLRVDPLVYHLSRVLFYASIRRIETTAQVSGFTTITVPTGGGVTNTCVNPCSGANGLGQPLFCSGGRLGILGAPNVSSVEAWEPGVGLYWSKTAGRKFVIGEDTISNLKSNGVPDESLTLLTSLIGKEFTGQELFNSLPDTMTMEHKRLTLTHAEIMSKPM